MDRQSIFDEDSRVEGRWLLREFKDDDSFIRETEKFPLDQEALEVSFSFPS